LAESSGDPLNEAQGSISLLTSDGSEINGSVKGQNFTLLSCDAPRQRIIEPSKRSSFHKVLTDKVRTWLNISSSTDASSSSRTSQQTVHTDDEGFKVVETHLLPSLDDSSASFVSAQSTLTDWKEGNAYQETVSRDNQAVMNMSIMDNKALREALEELGVQPGPITIATRKIYENKLHRLMNDPAVMADRDNDDSEYIHCCNPTYLPQRFLFFFI
jgi:hypothetical protein